VEQDQVIAEIERLGGSIERDENDPANPVVGVQLSGIHATDRALKHIGRLANLRTIDLAFSLVTDTALVYLRGLAYLQKLDLTNALITDAGLRHLERRSGLLWLNLSSTDVTDTGLGRLVGGYNQKSCTGV
jgi:Leucine Rich repeat